MCEQQRQLDIMAMGGFDIDVNQTDSVNGTVIPDNLNPEKLVLIKEQVECDILNPCINCIHEHTDDPLILDYCHYQCKETVTGVSISQ